MGYDNEPAVDGHYEHILGFFYQDDTESGSQSFTISFSLTEEMENDFVELERAGGTFQQKEERKEMWVANHIDYLLEFGLVHKVYSHDEIDSEAALKEALEEGRISFDAYYR